MSDQNVWNIQNINNVDVKWLSVLDRYQHDKIDSLVSDSILKFCFIFAL